MRHGQYVPSSEGHRVTPVTFELLSCDVPPIPSLNVPKTRQGMTVRELYERQQRLEQQYQQTPSQLTRGNMQKDRQEVAERLSLPFACLAVSLVAAPLGARAKRSGRSYTFAIGLAIVMIYYVLKLLLEPRSLHALSTVVLRAWGPNLALCGAGLWFVWRVDRT